MNRAAPDPSRIKADQGSTTHGSDSAPGEKQAVRPTHSAWPWRLSWAVLPASAVLLLILSTAALGVGRYPISPLDVVRAFFYTPVTSATGIDSSGYLTGQLGTALAAHRAMLHAIVIDARLPRLVAAALIGAALSVSGTAYQAVFRNPLVSPGMLGVLSGSAFGAALGIVCGLQETGVQVAAFIAGLAAVLLGLGIAALLQSGMILTLMLGGLISNALFTALLSLVKYTADPLNQLPAIVFWMLGSLAQVGWTDLARFGVPLLLGTLLLCVSGRVLDALSLSDDEAQSLGVHVMPIRLGVIALATLLATLTVSLAGIIGWIGLLVPHLARASVGASNTRVLPLSALFGAMLMIAADTSARTLSAGEIPLGIITELFGAIAFILVLRRFRGSLG